MSRRPTKGQLRALCETHDILTGHALAEVLDVSPRAAAHYLSDCSTVQISRPLWLLLQAKLLARSGQGPKALTLLKSQ